MTASGEALPVQVNSDPVGGKKKLHKKGAPVVDQLAAASKCRRPPR